MQRDRPRVLELLGEVEDEARGGRAEAVDGLEVVADRGDGAAGGGEARDDVDLQLVDVLVLVDEDVVEAARDGREPASGSAISARQKTSRSSRSSMPSARLRAV